MSDAGDFDDYLKTLGRLTSHVDPTASTPEAERITTATGSLGELLDTDVAGLAAWARDHPADVPVLGLAVGLSQEKLKNVLRDRFGTTGWHGVARTQPVDLVTWLDTEFDLVRMLRTQLERTYTFADILVARAGSRVKGASCTTRDRLETTRPWCAGLARWSPLGMGMLFCLRMCG